MAGLTLCYHPLSSYCWKALIALYEHGTPFTPVIVDLGNPEESDALKRLWPMRKFPVLTDGESIVPESTIIIEYLDESARRLIPADVALARATRLADRIFDLYLHNPMQRLVGEHLRPADKKDPLGVEQAKASIATALDMLETRMTDGRRWAMGESFTLADCAALPALYYVNRLLPFGASHPKAAAYLGRLSARPSIARVLKEAEPYLKMFPA